MERIDRRLIPRVSSMLDKFSAVVLTGARAIGKSTLSREIARGRASVVYDLENALDRSKLVNNAVEELNAHSNKLVVLDEVQQLPDIFAQLRGIIDKRVYGGNRTGHFLLLGSADGKLQRQTRESLAGRVFRIRLHGLDWHEVAADGNLRKSWDRGGYPQSYLAKDDLDSMLWRNEYISNIVVRDMVSAGARVAGGTVEGLLNYVAASQGSFVNMKHIASGLQIKQTTVARYLGMLEELMIVRKLPAYALSTAKRFAKRPKYYICDSGLMGALCNLSVNPAIVPGQEQLAGASWEGFVVENLMSVLPQGWRASYYRDQSDYEIDLVLERAGRRPWAIEIKSGKYVLPSLKSRRVLDVLKPERAFQVYFGRERHRLGSDIVALPLADMMNELLAQDPAYVAAHGGPRPAQVRNDASVLLVAIREGRRDVSFLRKDFVRTFLSGTSTLVREAESLNDSNFRNGWKHVRSELAAWFEAESTVDVDSPSCGYWPSMRTLLEGLLEIKFASGMYGNDRNVGEIVAGWCAFDTFVNLIAALLYNDKFNLLNFVLQHSYFAHDRLRKSWGFWTAASPASAEEDGALAELVFDDQAPETHALIEAELICVLYSIANPGEQGSDWYWYPRLYGGIPNKNLPFFARAADQAAGMVNLLTCLGLGNDKSSYDKLRQQTSARMQSQQQSRFFDCENLLSAMCFGE